MMHLKGCAIFSAVVAETAPVAGQRKFLLAGWTLQPIGRSHIGIVGRVQRVDIRLVCRRAGRERMIETLMHG
jgi:hypothetical protein